jgi:hypothetical protein
MGLDRNPRAAPVRWGGALAWVAAWALVAAVGHLLPLWAAIAAAIAVFGAQLLLAPGRPACHLPDATRDGVTKNTPARGP